MELLTPERVPQGEIRRTFRHGPWFSVLFLPVWTALPGVAGLLGARAGLPVLVWVLAMPVVLVAALVWLVVLAALVDALRASLRASNWVLKVGDDGVYLQLRSYLNQHFRADHPTVLFVPFSEITSASKVCERYERCEGQRRVSCARSWLELVLQRATTVELGRVLALERTTQAPQRSFLGLRSRTRYRHVPVVVATPDRIRVDWRPGMLRPFEARVRTAPDRTVDLDIASPEPRERLLALVERGDHLAAVDLARRTYGYGLGEAKRFLDELQRPAA